MLRGPSKTRPFFGGLRGFSFEREVQPVIDKYCVGCHDGTKNLTADGCCTKCGTKCSGVFEGGPGDWGAKRQPVRLGG